MQMTPVFNPFQKVSNDPVMDAMIVALKQENESYKRTLAISEMMIQRLKEELRLERIRKYGKRSEKLSDLQLELLGNEPAVSSEEIVAESQRVPLAEESNEEKTKTPPAQQQKKRKPHPGRNELPAHLERVEKIIACAADECRCGKCGAETSVIGYEETEVLGMRPAVH